jgi:hypothetical protein
MMLAARLVDRLMTRLGEERMVRLGVALMIGYILAALQPTMAWFPLATLLATAAVLAIFAIGAAPVLRCSKQEIGD